MDCRASIAHADEGSVCSLTSSVAEIVPVQTDGELREVRSLFLEYGRSLDFHICFQSFEEEVAGLPVPTPRLRAAFSSRSTTVSLPVVSRCGSWKTAFAR